MNIKIRMLLHNSSFIIWSGLLPGIFGILTIVSCYHLSVNVYNHFPSWLWAPVISLLGCLSPEHFVYQIGFTITALSLLLFYFTFQNGILKVLPISHKISINTLKFTILSCAIGVFGQGIITLNDDVVNILTNENEIENYVPSNTDILHQLLAMIFFLSGLIHGIVSTFVYFKLKDNDIIKLLKFSRWFKLFMVLISLIQIIASVKNHPTNFNNKGKTHELLNMAGVAQWIIIIVYLAFFSSYSLDYYLILKKRREKNLIDINDDTLLMDEVEMFLGKDIKL
eukprot:285865_1